MTPFEITRIEVHDLDSCPCLECGQERARRTSAHPAESSLRIIPLEAATALRLIIRRPAGSLARELMLAEKAD